MATRSLDGDRKHAAVRPVALSVRAEKERTTATPSTTRTHEKAAAVAVAAASKRLDSRIEGTMRSACVCGCCADMATLDVQICCEPSAPMRSETLRRSHRSSARPQVHHRQQHQCRHQHLLRSSRAKRLLIVSLRRAARRPKSHSRHECSSMRSARSRPRLAALEQAVESAPVVATSHQRRQRGRQSNTNSNSNSSITTTIRRLMSSSSVTGASRHARHIVLSSSVM